MNDNSNQTNTNKETFQECRLCKIFEGKPFLCGSCQWSAYQRRISEGLELDRKIMEAKIK
jgi:hypothetical protein